MNIEKMDALTPKENLPEPQEKLTTEDAAPEPPLKNGGRKKKSDFDNTQVVKMVRINPNTGAKTDA